MWEKIVFNLLSNAVKYTNSGYVFVNRIAAQSLKQPSFINLNVLFTASNAILRVQDTGCGIPEDQLDKVLMRFHRVEVSEGRSSEGKKKNRETTLFDNLFP